MNTATRGSWVASGAGPWLAVFLVTCWTTGAAHSALNLTAAATKARLLQKETAAAQTVNGGSFFYTNVGPNSFEYRGMFAPGETPVDFHKNFQELFDKFPDFPEFEYPKVVQQPIPTPTPVVNQQPYVPLQHYNPPATVPHRRLIPTTRSPQVVPQYEFYRIRTPTATPRVNPIQQVGRQLVNQVPVQPYVQPLVNQVPIQPLVNHIPVQPFVQPGQPLVNPAQPLSPPLQPQYRFSPLVDQVQPLVNPFQPFVNPVVQPVQPKYHIPIPTIAPRIEHDDQPYINPAQPPYQFPISFPEYHLVRGQTRAESYPKIFTFTDGRINIVDFESKKKKNQGKKVQYGDGLDPDQVSRDQFLILHGGYYPTDKYSGNDEKYGDNRVLYDSYNDVRDLQKLTPNLAYFYQ